MKSKITIGSLIVALGIVYGDIGTSPLYVMNALMRPFNGKTVDPAYVLGCLSLVFWTITLLTTSKYVIFVLRADNHGEGGIFALYALVRKRKKWVIIPAIIGGAALLADSVLTPAVTVTSAIEGLTYIPGLEFESETIILIIVVIVISIIFLIQRFGTSFIGKMFGPIMLGWFLFIGLIGLYNISSDVTVLKALNPIYAINLLTGDYSAYAFLILGAVFLATTGAEALYSDMGHVGRKNIYGTWPFVKICLLLNYFGQGAWILSNPTFEGNPFFLCMPEFLITFGVIIATAAAIIASQALISGTYTLISEAITLGIFPKLDIKYPADEKGQMYIPAINTMLWVACIMVVLFFKSSSNMEAAYGMAITITMMMTSLLLFEYLRSFKATKNIALIVFLVFISIELTFFVSSLLKFLEGGYITFLLGFIYSFIMFIWFYGGRIKKTLYRRVKLSDYTHQLNKLRHDEHVDKLANNIVYLTADKNNKYIDQNIAESIFDHVPKRGDIYWFVNINVSDYPYGSDYSFETFNTNYLVALNITLGFKVEQNIDDIINEIANELFESKVLVKPKREYSSGLSENGDFVYVIIRDVIANTIELPEYKKHILNTKFRIKNKTASPEKWYGIKHCRIIKEDVVLKSKKLLKI